MNKNWLNYHHLYYFWLLSREGSFTKVAEKLSIAQSAVSGQINQLEESLGLSLIDRTNKRKPIFTEEGKKVLEYSNNIFETGDELLQWANRGIIKKESIVKIGALSGLSRNFQYEFIKPALKIQNLKIEVITGDQSKLTKLLSEHSLDLFLSSHNVSSEGRTTFFSHVLYTSPLVFVISKKALDGRKNLDSQLAKKKLFLPGKNFEARPELDAFLDSKKYNVDVAGEVDDIALLRILAIESNEIVAIPEMGIKNELKSKELVILEGENKIFQKFYAITRSKKIPNKIISTLIGQFK